MATTRTNHRNPKTISRWFLLIRPSSTLPPVSQIVRQVEYNTFAWIQNLKVKCLGKSSRIATHKNTQVFFTLQVEKKLLKASVLWKEDSRIHRNIKIARDGRAIKLGCSDWCCLPLNASERTRLITSNLLVVHSACFMFTARTRDRHYELAAMDLSMNAVALTPSWLAWILTVMQFVFFIIPLLFSCVFEHETFYTIWVLAVFDFYYRMYACSLTEGETFKT